MIGPYDSGDFHVLEYQLLTMKLAGIDGVIADNLAFEQAPAGLRNWWRLQFIRTVTSTTADPLTIQVQLIDDTATRVDDLVGPPSVLTDVYFEAPSAEDKARGYQVKTFNQRVKSDGLIEFRESLTLKILPSQDLPGATYTLLENDTYVPGFNRRTVWNETKLWIHDGVTIACQPHQGGPDTSDVYWDDVRQVLGDCYLAAAMIAATRKNPAQIRNMIDSTNDGLKVTLSGGYEVYLTWDDLNRGPDSLSLEGKEGLESDRGWDVNGHGELEIWPLAIEAAFANGRAEGTPNNWWFVGGGDASDAYRYITGRAVTDLYPDNEATRNAYQGQTYLDVAALEREIRDADLAAMQVMISMRYSHPYMDGGKLKWLSSNHVYVVDKLIGSTITLIDPLGTVVDVPVGEWLQSKTKRIMICH